MKNLLLLTLLFAILQLHAQSQKFRLEGEIKDADSLSSASLIAWGNCKLQAEEVKIENRKFIFEGTLENPCIVVINTDKVRGGLGLWLTPGTTRAVFYVKEHTPTLRLLQTQSVSGSQESVDYLSFLNHQNEKFNKIEDRIKRSEAFWAYINAYVVQNPQRHLGFFMIRSGLQSAGLGLARTTYDQLAENLKNSSEGESLLKEIEKVEANFLGKKITAFSLPDTAGQIVKIDSSAKHWTLLHFWASWCVPCRHEHKTMLSYAQSWQNKNLRIVGISLDDDKNDWVQAIKKDQINWLQLSDLKGWKSSEVIQSFKITYVPYSILLDEEMTIKAVGMHNIVETLKKR